MVNFKGSEGFPNFSRGGGGGSNFFQGGEGGGVGLTAYSL